jgi:hypothetical protein
MQAFWVILCARSTSATGVACLLAVCNGTRQPDDLTGPERLDGSDLMVAFVDKCCQ